MQSLFISPNSKIWPSNRKEGGGEQNSVGGRHKNIIEQEAKRDSQKQAGEIVKENRNKV